MSSARMNTVMETDGEKKERNIRPLQFSLIRGVSQASSGRPTMTITTSSAVSCSCIRGSATSASQL